MSTEPGHLQSIFLAGRLLVAIEELWKLLGAAEWFGYVDLRRRGDHLEVVTRGAIAAPPPVFATAPALQLLAARCDPHRLHNPDISERHEDYNTFRLSRLSGEKWALDCRLHPRRVGAIPRAQLVEIDETVAVKEIEFRMEAGRGDPERGGGAANVELFVLVVAEGVGDVAK